MLRALVGVLLALPRHVDRVRLLRVPVAECAAVALVHRDGDGFDCVVRDSDGHDLLTVEGYRTVAFERDVPEDVRAPLRSMLHR